MNIKDEVKKCLFCYEAPCKTACDKNNVSRLMQALYLNNVGYFCEEINDTCLNCDGRCNKECIADVNILEVFKGVIKVKETYYKKMPYKDIDISSDICGVEIENPFILSSSVVGSNYEMISKAFELGWAGVVYKTISLMEMNEASPRYAAVKLCNYMYGFKNVEQLSDHSVEENMEVFRRLKKNYPNKVIIASIMGRNEQEWEYLARVVTEAGADLIELNFSCPNMEEKNSGSDVGQNPELCKKYTIAARKGTNLPILAKMTPNITDMREPAYASVLGGADGISAINTIKSITGIDLEREVAYPAINRKSMIGGYSGIAVKPIALRFIVEMANDPRLKDVSFSGMGGVETWEDAIDFIMLGCSSVQVTTAIMQFGYRIIDDLISGLKIFMAQKGYRKISEFKGAALNSIVESNQIDRSTIVYPKFIRENCIGCGRCYVSCFDGGHQAIKFDIETRTVTLNPQKCVGCLLCSLVCPNEAIINSRRIKK